MYHFVVTLVFVLLNFKLKGGLFCCGILIMKQLQSTLAYLYLMGKQKFLSTLSLNCPSEVQHSIASSFSAESMLIYLFISGGSPGLVVMGNDSCLKGRGLESQCRIIDGHFSH